MMFFPDGLPHEIQAQLEKKRQEGQFVDISQVKIKCL